MFCLVLTVHSVQRLGAGHKFVDKVDADSLYDNVKAEPTRASSRTNKDGDNALVPKLTNVGNDGADLDDKSAVQQKSVGGDDAQFDIHAFAANQPHGASAANKSLSSRERDRLLHVNKTVTFFDDGSDDDSEANDTTPYRRPPTVLCPERSPHLTGRLAQGLLVVDELKESSVSDNHPELRKGGVWKPLECIARFKVWIHISR